MLSQPCWGAGVKYWSIGRGQGPLHDLAWGFDLVLTTFTRLSADWAADSANSPLKQVTQPHAPYSLQSHDDVLDKCAVHA